LWNNGKYANEDLKSKCRGAIPETHCLMLCASAKPFCIGILPACVSGWFFTYTAFMLSISHSVRYVYYTWRFGN
jgi:hypothetical protein